MLAKSLGREAASVAGGNVVDCHALETDKEIIAIGVIAIFEMHSSICSNILSEFKFLEITIFGRKAGTLLTVHGSQAIER